MNPSPGRSSSAPRQDEAALVRAAQGGDEVAFAELVRRYQRAVYRIAYGLTRNGADADDLAQETFVRAYQALDRFRADEPLYPWLARITVNLAYSLFRRRRRRPETAIEPLIEAGQQWAADDDPTRDAAEAERREQLQASFAELTQEHQAILVLRVVEGLSYDEIARTLGVPMGTVMSRLSRARAELKTRFRARSGEPPEESE
jgi:RNA polymerase sigma-70 factor (ECF subfamily)